MKTKAMMLMAAMLIFGMTSLFAMEAKTEKIKVYGNCGQCKTRIEKAVKAVPGVSKATWESKDEMLTVTYDATKTTTLKIQEAVSKVGHDTDQTMASDNSYNALPACCKYDRPVKK